MIKSPKKAREGYYYAHVYIAFRKSIVEYEFSNRTLAIEFATGEFEKNNVYKVKVLIAERTKHDDITGKLIFELV